MDTAQILKRLASVPAVSGFEKELGISEEISKFFPSYNPIITPSGTVIIKTGKGRRRILIDAHIDEVGFIKTDTGFVKIGDISDDAIETQKIVEDGRINHVAYFKREFKIEGNMVKSPALDNKAGCTTLVMLAEEVKSVDAEIYLAFTTKEETTQSGMIEAVMQTRPEIVICIDSAYAKPFENKGWQIPECGKGPAIQLQGKGFVTKTADIIEKVARRNRLPYQFEIVDSDSGATNLSAVPAAATVMQINIPVRYQHTAMCEADIRDIENTTRLIAKIVEEFAKDNKLFK